MANIDEAFAALSDVQSVSVNENVDFVVDSYLRVISIPVRGVVLGVEGDKDVNRVTFRMSRTYKGVDMSQFQIRINYANANNELNYFKVTEITVSDDEIVFVWVVGADAVAYVGNVEFVVRFIKLSGSNIIQELNTTLTTAKSLIGLSVDGEISPVQREDLLAHFYNEIDAYSETKKNEILDSIPEDYTALANEVDELKGDLNDINDCLGLPAKKELTDYNVQNGYYNNDLENIQGSSSNNFKCAVIDVKEKEKYEVKAYIYGSAIHLWKLFNDGVFVKASEYNGSTGGYYEEVITIPSGVNQMLISWYTPSGNDVYEHYLVKYQTDAITNINIRIDNLKSDMDAINTATDENIGKVLKVKKVEGGKVTEWEFGESNSSGLTAENILYSDDEQYSDNTVGKNIRTINDALNFPLKKELTDYDVTDGLYVNGIIANKTTDSRWQSTILDVVESEQYEIYSYLNASANYLWAYANGGEFVSRSQFRGNPIGYYNETITIPEGVDQLVISWWAANEHHIYKIGVDKLEELTKKINVIPTLIAENVNNAIEKDVKPYIFTKKGKKIAWFGTSIADGFRIPNTIDSSYPAKIAEMTGAIVDNQAVGASCLRGGDYKSKSENDPYGMSTTPYNFLMKSMCIPSSVKQKWFDDWETYKTIIPYAPDTIPDSNKNLFLSCSYDKKLDPYLVDDNVPDLFVLDYGYNERVGNGFDDEMLAMPDDEYDITYPIGAFNFIVNRILSKQPKAKIALVGLYENDNKKQVAKLQQMYADKWNLPFIKLWEHLGWTQNKITVTGEWQVDSTYPALYHWVETGVEKQMTLMDRFVPDHIHPYSDASGYSNQQIANVLAEWISHLNF